MVVPSRGRAQPVLLRPLVSRRKEVRPVKRLLAFLLVLAAVVPAEAAAHPLGNFTTNHFSRVVASGDRVYVKYVLDLAEIPTFQERSEAPVERAAYARELVAHVSHRISLRIGGARVALREVDHALAFPPGAAGLRTTRLEA